MAATSSSISSAEKSFKYDVFLSFRGEDTRRTFVDHLYHALQQKSIHTYKDEERIEKGKRIGDELIKSIEDSKFYIIVFSKNYASSFWCLEELIKIMECQKTTQHNAYPVFYDVEPTEVRKQIGEFGKAFAKHENDEAAEKWREALKEAADLAGWELKNTLDGHEAKFIKKIVEVISLGLRSTYFNVDEKLIGMEARIRDVVSSLEIGLDDVRMIGIKGMGGGGKTTLARAVFDQISFQFEGSSFVENVRENSNPNFSDLKKLQKQVLKDVLNDSGIKISNVHDGKKMMKMMMCHRKVLIVLDDVDHIDQLKALAGELNWFNMGSRIIITTRDEQVLVAHRVNLILDVNLLSRVEAFCLFNRYAFGRDSPIQGYEELSEQVVRYAAGLPLTITVLGSFLCGKNELEWKDAIKRLKTIPLKDTLEKLELSYIGLEEDYKQIFLDVACMLKGWWKEDAITALESCGFHAINGLRVLEQKSLITILKKYGRECLGMHDHVEEMGKNIVRRLHPNESNKHSRLWITNEIEDILSNDMGTKSITCIHLDAWNWDINTELVMRGLGNMKNLRFLKVDRGDFNWKSDEVSQTFPNALRYLSLDEFPFESLPKTFQANNLVALEMIGSKIVQLWEGGERKVLKKLRFLNFEYSKLMSLDLGLTPNLETLSLEGCYDLVELHIPIESCLKLKSLNINYSHLRTLDLRGTPHLEKLKLKDCFDLVELYIPVESRLKLRSLNIVYSHLRTLGLRGTLYLETLSLIGCDDLEELYMPVECLKLESIIIMGAKLKTLDLGWTPNLKKLSLTECYHLVEIHAHDGCLKKLDYLGLSGCLRFKSFLFRKQFESVEVGCVSKLHLIAESLDMCPLHFGNNLPKFRFTCFYEEHGPSLIGNLEKLISFGLCACTNLELFSQSIYGLRCLTKLTLQDSIQEAPKDLDQLESLEELSLLSTKITHLPDSICLLKHLKFLELNPCSLLEKLPEDLGRLECLEMLILSECVFLRDIPDSICKMKRLRYFHLRYCVAVEKLPEELGRLECLKELNIEGTNIRKLPQSIFELKGLRIVAFRWLLESCGFISGIQTSEDETFCYIEL